jgi:glycosyltransferase involved in cell wall biosynthesis
MTENTHNSSVVISVIIPIFNEEEVIPELYNRLKNAVLQISENYELIFVNDGSKDNSLSELKKLTALDARVFYLNFSRNFGHQIAVTAGIDNCNGDAVVIIDADLQDPPELIPQLYTKHKEGYNVVYATRKKRKGESFFKKITAKIFYRFLRSATSIDIPLDTGDFRLIDRKIVTALKQMPEQSKFLRGQIAWLGFKQSNVDYDRDERKYGETGYPFSKMLSFAMDGITGFSDKPLLFVSKLGFIISFLSFLIILYAIFSHFILDQTITGWTSLIISSMFIGGVQLISIGIIGEYISRINKNVQDRPLYLIEETNMKKNTSII